MKSVIFYFSKIIAQFDRNPVWSLCAYNSGAGRCRGWLNKLSKLPIALQIEAIPYDETRIYIEKILAGWALTAPVDPTRLQFLSDGLLIKTKKASTKTQGLKK